MNITPTPRKATTRPDGLERVHKNDGQGNFACGQTVYKHQLPIVETHALCTCEQCFANVHVECLRSGQTRRYGDSEYEYEITDLIGGRSKEEMLQIAIDVVKTSYASSELGSSFGPCRKRFREIRPGVWSYLVTKMYTG